MSNQSYMSPTFEREKNLKAGMYTLLVCGILLITFFFAKWTLPQIPPPVLQDGIEVNLGNSDEGLGDIAPQIPGEPSASNETYDAPPPAAQEAVNDVQDIATDDNDADAPAISKPSKPVVKTAPRPVEKTEVVKPRVNTSTVSNPTPAPPQPKAIYKGGSSNGPGGNGGDTYNNVRNQGIAGGNGDQGNPNGNPNSDSYKGNASSGHSGVRITRGLGGRRFTRLPSFEDDFNENAKVAVDIRVDKNGNVVSATINPRGTTTTNGNVRSIATRKALQLKLNAGAEDEQTGTIVFDFKLRG